MYETLLYGCRVHLSRGFRYQTVHVVPGNVTGYVVLDGAKVPVFVVDGSKQYEWAISRAVAAVHAAEYRRR